MYSTELLYQLGKLRQQDLVREMEKARLINAAIHGRPLRRSILSKTIKGFTSRLSDNQRRVAVALGEQSISQPCCPQSKS